jgi:hypothetical protein
MSFLIDHAAKDIALHRWALPESLHVPTAATDEAAIANYIGEIVEILAGGDPNRAFLVRAKPPPATDPRLPIWGLEGSAVFHRPMQVWVHVAYGRYRHAYRKAFPTEDIKGKVLSHALNRRVAVLKGFQYVRITPVTRGANSSSGFSEKWAVALHATAEQAAANVRRAARIQYADLSDLLLMMDLKLGGGIMDQVNHAQALVRPQA